MTNNRSNTDQFVIPRYIKECESPFFSLKSHSFTGRDAEIARGCPATHSMEVFVLATIFYNFGKVVRQNRHDRTTLLVHFTQVGALLDPEQWLRYFIFQEYELGHDDADVITDWTIEKLTIFNSEEIKSLPFSSFDWVYQEAEVEDYVIELYDKALRRV